MAQPGHFFLARTTRAYPRLPYRKMKDDILGASYTLSLVFVGRGRGRALHRAGRGKTRAPNILSFPLTANDGEVFITPEVARKEARARGMTARGYVGYLFIHGLLHLKGMQHGDTMERLEKAHCRRYTLG